MWRQWQMWQRALAVIVTGLAVMVPACSDEGSETTDPPAAAVVLRIVAGGEVAADWTLADLEAAVDFTELTLDGSEQSGPLLLNVLAASDVGDWETAEVFGMGEGRIFEVTLDIKATDVDDEWILDVTKQGALKLAATALPREQWVRDVGEIRLLP